MVTEYASGTYWARIDPADRTRAGHIAGLRMLADLLEAQPDIPCYEHGVISFAVGGPQDEAFAVIEGAAAALRAAGVPHEHHTDDHSHSVEFVVAGLRYQFSRVYDAAWADAQARRSYEPNIQITPVAQVTGTQGGGRR